MAQPRRAFLKMLSSLGGATLGASYLNALKAEEWHQQLADFSHLSPEKAATDEDFWFLIQQAYTSSPNLVNLNNGGVSPQPRVVQEAIATYNRVSNEAPAYYMWRTLGRLREAVRRQLAELAGCSSREIAIVRNATEALETVLFGLNLQAGDEILTTDQDYPSMLNTLAQREQRDGIKLTKIKLPVPCEDGDEIVRRFEEAITPQTRVILACHMINLTGQILPIRAICDMAHRHGLEVVVDGAHSFAQLDFNIPDLGCDYFGTSLHKWLSAPFGSGLLYVKEEKIPDVWPLFGFVHGEENQIIKFEHLGTRSFPIELGIGTAIDFHHGIGSARKEARLRYLKNYWGQQVRHMPGVHFNSSFEDEYGCLIANVAVEGIPPGELAKQLLNEYQLFAIAINHEDVKGVRVSPNVYTTLKDLDRLVEAFDDITRKATR